MTLRHVTISCIALATLIMPSGCLDDKCETKSAQVELTVSFSGTGGAQRLEFETRVDAPGAPGKPNYITMRRGSMPRRAACERPGRRWP